MSRAAVDDLLAAVRPDCLVVFDEAYRELVTEPDTPDALEVVAERPNVLVLRTFSKAYGLAALRRLQVPFEVNAVAQAAALASLGAEAELDTARDYGLV